MIRRRSALAALGLLCLLAPGCRSGPAGDTPRPPDSAGHAPAPVESVEPPPSRPERGPALSRPAAGRSGTRPLGIGLASGEPVPDASARDADGVEVRLAEIVGERPFVLVFYRGGWCPYCNVQLRELTGAWPEFERRGWGIVAVSVDRVEGAAQTTAAYDIPFPLLSDPDLSFHRAFAVVQHADEAEVARLKGFGLDIERASGRTHHEFAIPSIFAIDADGVVRWAHADPDYKARPSPAQVLAAIDALPPASE